MPGLPVRTVIRASLLLCSYWAAPTRSYWAVLIPWAHTEEHTETLLLSPKQCSLSTKGKRQGAAACWGGGTWVCRSEGSLEQHPLGQGSGWKGPGGEPDQMGLTPLFKTWVLRKLDSAPTSLQNRTATRTPVCITHLFSHWIHVYDPISGMTLPTWHLNEFLERAKVKLHTAFMMARYWFYQWMHKWGQQYNMPPKNFLWEEFITLRWILLLICANPNGLRIEFYWSQYKSTQLVWC